MLRDKNITITNVIQRAQEIKIIMTKNALELVKAYTSTSPLRRKPSIEEFDQIDVNTLETLDGSKRTALHIAVKHNAFDVVKKLVKKGAKLEVKDDKNSTPLIYAALAADSNETAKKIMLYLGDQGADINEVLAISNHNHPLIITLQKFSPLHIVIDALNPKYRANRNNSIREKFSEISNDISKYREYINQPACYGNTPLHLLLSHLAYFSASVSNETVMPYLEPVIKKMFEVGADINAKNIHGYTPLICFFQKLHDKSDRISFESDNSVKQVGSKLIQLFTEKNEFNIDHQDNQGRTLLMHIVLRRSFRLEHVRILVEKRANISLQQKDEYIQTAWDMVKYYGRQDQTDLQDLLQPKPCKIEETTLNHDEQTNSESLKNPNDDQSCNDVSSINDTSIEPQLFQWQYPELEKQIDVGLLIPALSTASAPEDAPEPIYQKPTSEMMLSPIQTMSMSERGVEIDMDKIISLYKAAQTDQHDVESVAELIKISRLRKVDVNIRKTASNFLMDLINRQHNPHAYIELGKILKKHQHGEEALGLFEKAVDLLQQREMNIYSSGNHYAFYQKNNLPPQNPNFSSNLLPKMGK